MNLKGRLQGFEIKISSSGQCNQTGFTSATSCYKDTTSTIQDIYTIDRCNQPTSTSISARTVYVTVSSQPLALCEVQIFSATPTVNVALRQQLVQQSSTNYGGVASRAVDGDTNSDFDNGKSCTHTLEVRSGWWCVDLQQLYYFNQIIIYNRQNTRWWDRLQGFEIKTSSSGQCSGQGLQLATSCYKDTTSTIQSVYNVTGCNQGSSTSFSGRTVYVSSINDTLTLCEVEIFADLAQCNTGYYRTSSSTCQPCNTCLNDRCDPTTGVCTGDCKTGFYGTKCQQSCNEGCLNNQCSKSDGRCTDCKPDTVGQYCNLTCGTECQPRTDQTLVTCDRTGRCTNCIVGRYGDRCDMNCNTGCSGGCDRDDGKCTSCIKGKTGGKCDINCNTDCTVCDRDNTNSCTECKDGRWGPSCNKLCSINCKSVVGTTVGKCYQMTGNCLNGCVPGKIGSNCTTDCEAGRYGENCDSKCGNCADETPCDIITGSCGLAGCTDGFQGPTCHDSVLLCACTPLSPVVYVVIGLLCGILGSVAVFLSYHFYKKRRQSKKPKEDIVPDYVYSNTDLNPTTSTTDDTLTTGYQNIPTNTRNVDYVNQSFNTEDNTGNTYDTLDHTVDDTPNTYTSIDSNKLK
ncbi:multiple epidermal growth factor-like domains protein 10 [Patella vulgata]|uniref:multiple epidermal growth factor-like domains protein 10 n=1 Tax=Patella vulgata TaxID=6465 RepID=UPI0024A9C708|nr:multiple epidermal growth factor-like domains protein 10 [Patella vulgata]